MIMIKISFECNDQLKLEKGHNIKQTHQARLFYEFWFLPIIPPVDWAPILAMSDATSDDDALSSAYAWP